jgi:nucleotide sugar dehydrogenase
VKVGIIGLGVVGSAQVEMFGEHDLVVYDVIEGLDYPYDELAACDFAVVCVGTPAAEDGSADLTYVEDAIARLPPALPVALRSTVPPGTTDRLLGGRALYCHAPEFMGENVLHSWQRPQDVPYMVIGGDSVSTLYFQQRFAQVFPGTITTCATRAAEMAKYLANLYWATRVTFVNEMAKVCEAFGVDYERARNAWLADPRMTEPYTQRAGYPPGFDGRCWPKDLNALIASSAAAGYEPEFLHAIADANERFRA